MWSRALHARTNQKQASLEPHFVYPRATCIARARRALSSTHEIGTAKLPYDTKSAFSAIGLVTEAPMTIIGRPDLPPESLKDLVAYLKGEPRPLVAIERLSGSCRGHLNLLPSRAARRGPVPAALA